MGCSCTILVVDDEHEIRNLASEILESLGYRVLEADSGTTALRVLDEHPEVNLLFTDVVMPGMSGQELAARALQSKPTLRVLLTSGYTRGVVVGDVPFLPKPWRSSDLSRALKALH